MNGVNASHYRAIWRLDYYCISYALAAYLTQRDRHTPWGHNKAHHHHNRSAHGTLLTHLSPTFQYSESALKQQTATKQLTAIVVPVLRYKQVCTKSTAVHAVIHHHAGTIIIFRCYCSACLGGPSDGLGELLASACRNVTPTSCNPLAETSGPPTPSKSRECWLQIHDSATKITFGTVGVSAIIVVSNKFEVGQP